MTRPERDRVLAALLVKAQALHRQNQLNSLRGKGDRYASQ